MDDQAVTTSNDCDQSVGTFIAGLVHIALLVQIVIHSVAATYAHASTRLL